MRLAGFLLASLLTVRAAFAAPEARYGAWRSCKMGGGGYLQNVVLCPTDPQRAYTYVDVGGLYRSDDGGRRWRMLHGNWPAAPGCYGVRGVSVDPRNADILLAAVGDQWPPIGILRSTDGGESWQRVLTALFRGNAPYRWTGFILARHPRNPDVLLTGAMGDGLFRSEDNGVTWRKIGLEGLCPTDVRFDARNPRRAWLCALPFSNQGQRPPLAGGFYRSDDGGVTFRKISDLSPSEILQDPLQPDILYGVFNGGGEIRRSLNGGDAWEPFSQGLPLDPQRKSGPSEHEFNALAAGPDFLLTASTRGTFYRLQCGESTWRKVERQRLGWTYEGEPWYHNGGFGDALGSITVDARDPNHWFFTDWFAIYQTRDAGKSWDLSIDGIEDTVLHCLTQDPSDPGVVHLGMADNGYFNSGDGGERFRHGDWRKGISNNIKCISLSPKDPNRLYAVGPQTWEWEANQVFVSIDRGATWTRSPMQGLPDMKVYHCDTIVADPADPFTVYLAVSKEVGPGRGGLYRSTDGGKAWAWIGQGLPEGAAFFQHDIWSVGRELAIGSDGSRVCLSRGLRRVFRWDEAQQRWVALSLSPKGAPNCVVADLAHPGRFFLAAGDLYRSEDGGATWQSVAGGDAMHVAVDQAKPERVAAGTRDGILLSTDGGTTWKPVDAHLPHRVRPLVAFAGERLLAGTSGSGAFWMPLSPAGEQPVTARPVPPPQPRPGTAPGPSLLPNGEMSEGQGTVPRWGLWTGAGKLALTRDTQVFHQAPAALCLSSEGGRGQGAASTGLTLSQEPFFVSGWARSTGNLKEALVAVQCFDAAGKQIGWVNLTDARNSGVWERFEAQVTLPPGTARAGLIVTLNGEGKVWLDSVTARTEPQAPVFR